MESQIECTWMTTNPWDQLLGYLHPSHCMARHLFLLHFVHNTTLENMTIGFRHGFSTGTHTNTTLHEYTKGIQDSQGQEQLSHGRNINSKYVQTKTRSESVG